MLVHFLGRPLIALVCALVVIEVLPVKCDREIDLLLIKLALLDHVLGIFAHVLFSVVTREEVQTHLETCSFCILVILLKLGVRSIAPDIFLLRLIVIVVSYIAAEDNEFAACSLDLLEIDVALILGNINADHSLGCLVISLEIRELQYRIAVDQI